MGLFDLWENQRVESLQVKSINELNELNNLIVYNNKLLEEILKELQEMNNKLNANSSEIK